MGFEWFQKYMKLSPKDLQEVNIDSRLKQLFQGNVLMTFSLPGNIMLNKH